jgi:hypothetical protein
MLDSLPSTWKVTINGGKQIVTLKPDEIRDITVVVTQTAAEPLGTRHSFRVIASRPVSLVNQATPRLRNELRSLSGVQFVTTVDVQTTLKCMGEKGGVVNGRIGNFMPSLSGPAATVLVGAIDAQGRFNNAITSLATVNRTAPLRQRSVTSIGQSSAVSACSPAPT